MDLDLPGETWRLVEAPNLLTNAWRSATFLSESAAR